MMRRWARERRSSARATTLLADALLAARSAAAAAAFRKGDGEMTIRSRHIRAL
jgi:hypothetical protein